jgi:hypothetical protein
LSDKIHNQPINDNLTSRIIPGLSAKYQIVSLPYWAWFWLDDFMRQNRISYKGIYDTFGGHGDINQTLHNLAEMHQEYSMREVYNLANDNELDHSEYMPHFNKIKAKRVKMKNKHLGLKLPKIYKLFGFMSCATTLEAVWKRRNYEESNKIN